MKRTYTIRGDSMLPQWVDIPSKNNNIPLPYLTPQRDAYGTYGKAKGRID